MSVTLLDVLQSIAALMSITVDLTLGAVKAPNLKRSTATPNWSLYKEAIKGGTPLEISLLFSLSVFDWSLIHGCVRCFAPCFVVRMARGVVLSERVREGGKEGHRVWGRNTENACRLRC